MRETALHQAAFDYICLQYQIESISTMFSVQEFLLT